MSPTKEDTMLLSVVIVSFSLMLAAVQTAPVGDSSYVAAVYEHNLILNPDPRVTATRAAALEHMQKNLDSYEVQAARAAEQGAQILVFPEVGIHGFGFSRLSIFNYLETAPDPEEESWNPCTEPGKHSNTEVLQRLSCMARRYNLYVVANVADLQPCPLKTDPSTCPSDGHWQFNTNVVFSSDGLLVARYHKQNPFFEEAFDTPPKAEIITFDTPFAGRFGLMICFDILFYEPTITLVEMGVRQLVFPTAWMNLLPLLDSVQFQQAFSMGANVSLLAANTRHDKLDMRGSGIFTPFSAVYHHSQRGDPEEGKLLVARVPVLDPLWLGQSTAAEEGKVSDESKASAATDPVTCLQKSCSNSPASLEIAPSVPPSSDTFVSSMMFDPFTFVLLKETEGDLKVCNGTFCCHLQYRRLPQAGSEELYALGAFDGLHIVDGRYALQVCALVHCAGSDFTTCGQGVEEAESKMDFLLEGKFGTKYVYPSVLVNKMALEHPKNLEKGEGGRVTMKHSNMTSGLVTACLYGRMYHLDDQ